MKVHLHGRTPDGTWYPVSVDDNGVLGGAMGAAPIPSDTWSYAAASGGIVNDTAVEIKAAAGAGLVNYISRLDVLNAHATVGTEIQILDGSTVIWRSHLGPSLATVEAQVPIPIPLDPPLYSSANAALNFKCGTTGAKVYVNAAGFVSGIPEQAEYESTPLIELLDDQSRILYDDQSRQLYT